MATSPEEVEEAGERLGVPPADAMRPMPWPMRGRPPGFRKSGGLTKLCELEMQEPLASMRLPLASRPESGREPPLVRAKRKER